MDNPIANIFNEKKLKVFLVKSGTEQGCPLSPVIKFNSKKKKQKQKQKNTHNPIKK